MRSATLTVQRASRRPLILICGVLLLALSACQATPQPTARLRPTAPVGATGQPNGEPTAAVGAPGEAASPTPPAGQAASPTPPQAGEAALTAAVGLAPLRGLPIGLAVNADTVAVLAPYLGPQDIIKLTSENLGLLGQLGRAQCSLHLPRLDAYTPEALLAVVPQADLDRCAFFTLSIEAHALPDADVADPSTFLAGVRGLADHFGKRLMVAVPTYRFVDSRGNFGGRRDLKTGSGVDAARYADILVVEAQKSVDKPAAFANLMRQVRPAALAVNPRVQVWAMIGCAEGRCDDSVDAFAAALAPLANELDGIWIFYPPANPALARDFVQQMRKAP